MIHPQAYHWILLTYCLIVAFVYGVFGIIKGSSPDSRFYPVDKITVKLIGAGLLTFSALIFLWESWVFYGLVCCFTLSIFDELLTIRTESLIITKYIGASKAYAFWTVFVLLTQGVPAVLLLSLRPIFIQG